MSEKFTKGPWVGFDGKKFQNMGAWSAENDECGSHSAVAVTDANGAVLCLVVEEGIRDRFIDANAALIAAAPDMYEMLDKISDGLLEAGGIGNCALAKEIEELLAKARGEA